MHCAHIVLILGVGSMMYTVTDISEMIRVFKLERSASETCKAMSASYQSVADKMSS